MPLPVGRPMTDFELNPGTLSGVDRQLVVDRVYGTSEQSMSARWELMLCHDDVPLGGRRFDYEGLVARARQRLPRKSYGTVTDFTSWIYELYGVQRKAEALLRGQAAEAQIYKSRIPRPRNPTWELVHCGMQGATEAAQPVPLCDYRSSSLIVKGQPLRASPDYVFRERTAARGSERIVIVEVKHSQAPIPVDLWPNVRAQLWAYSKIDTFASASEIILVAEVWGGVKSPGLRRSASWRRGDEQLEFECAQLFNVYRSLVEATR